MEKCTSCPRECGADRNSGRGYCAMPWDIYVARIGLHLWEEPIISGTDPSRGSGTVFFSGCNLRCVFCQNFDLSHHAHGSLITPEELYDEMLKLEAAGAYNINLVTPTHYLSVLLPLLEKIKPSLSIPIVYNTSGYEKVESLRALEGLVDIYLPDFKYYSSELSEKYSNARDYFEVASGALCEMYRQVGKLELDGNGVAKKGMIVRHLVLPGCRHDSIEVLQRLANLLPVSDIRLSLMRQYTPDFALGCEYKNLHRRLTNFEYSSVLKVAGELGFDGFFQGRDSADAKYTPDFK